jgi:hypothetical protein
LFQNFYNIVTNALGCFLIGDFVSLRGLFEDIKELRAQTGVGEP